MLQDEEGFDVVRYSYDDWGKVTIVREMTDFNLGHENPFRWRGYVYDRESAFYYLITRYYDSKTGRFINEDDHAFLGASGNTLGYNLYAYCENDPVNCVDPTGQLVITTTMLICAGIGALLLGAAGGIAGYYISKNMNAPKGSRWKYITGGAILGAIGGAVLGFGLGYFVGGGSVVAVVGKTGVAFSKEPLLIANKLNYIFGEASGTVHNINRSKSMYALLNRIGIWNTKLWKEYLTKCIVEIYKSAVPYVSEGKLIKEAMLYGPGGGIMIRTIWEGSKLITIYLFG